MDEEAYREENLMKASDPTRGRRQLKPRTPPKLVGLRDGGHQHRPQKPDIVTSTQSLFTHVTIRGILKS